MPMPSQAVCNMLNILMGVGLLSLPYAFKRSGWIGLVILEGHALQSGMDHQRAEIPALKQCIDRCADAIQVGGKKGIEC